VSTMICPSELIRTPEIDRPLFSTAFTACVMWLGRNGHFPFDMNNPSRDDVLHSVSPRAGELMPSARGLARNAADWRALNIAVQQIVDSARCAPSREIPQKMYFDNGFQSAILGASTECGNTRPRLDTARWSADAQCPK
jgi:hypothetical protein